MPLRRLQGPLEAPEEGFHDDSIPSAAKELEAESDAVCNAFPSPLGNIHSTEEPIKRHFQLRERILSRFSSLKAARDVDDEAVALFDKKKRQLKAVRSRTKKAYLKSQMEIQWKAEQKCYFLVGIFIMSMQLFLIAVSHAFGAAPRTQPQMTLLRVRCQASQPLLCFPTSPPWLWRSPITCAVLAQLGPMRMTLKITYCPLLHLVAILSIIQTWGFMQKGTVCFVKLKCLSFPVSRENFCLDPLI